MKQGMRWNTHSACGKGKRFFGVCRSSIPSSSVNGPSRQRPVKPQGTCPCMSLNPSQTYFVVVGMRLTPPPCRGNGRMGWMRTLVFGCTPELTSNADNAHPILKHKKTPRPCFSRKGTCRQAQEAPWRSRSRRWYAPPQVCSFFD